MNQTEKLLQAVVENGRMGASACKQLMEKTKDEALRTELIREKTDYENAVNSAEKMLQDMGVKPQPKGPMARMGMWMGMEMDTIMDHSASHIADMVIQGATMGIVEMTKARNSFPDADPNAQGIIAGLITCQQESIDRLKAFLQEKVVL